MGKLLFIDDYRSRVRQAPAAARASVRNDTENGVGWYRADFDARELAENVRGDLAVQLLVGAATLENRDGVAILSSSLPEGGMSIYLSAEAAVAFPRLLRTHGFEPSDEPTSEARLVFGARETVWTGRSATAAE